MNHQIWKRLSFLVLSLCLVMLLFTCAQAEVTAQDVEWETAKSLGWIDDTVDPDSVCTKAQLYEILNHAVQQRTGKTCEWIDWETEDPMLRLYVPRILYEAAINMGYTVKDSAGQDNANINDPTGMMNSTDIWLCGEQYRGIDVCPDYEEFCNDNTGCKEFDINSWYWFNPGEFATFAAKQECFVNDQPVMELAEDGRFRAFDELTVQEAVSAAFRLYCSFGDYAAAEEVYRAVEYDMHLASAVQIQFSSENLEKQVRLQLNLEQDEPVYDFMLEEFGLTELNGTLTEEVWNATPITARGMMALLDDTVQSAAPERYEEWRTYFPIARESNLLLNRADGICFLYTAACAAFPEQSVISDITDRGMRLSWDGPGWDDYCPHGELFEPMIGQDSPWHGWEFSASASFFCYGAVTTSGKMFFEMDQNTKDLHCSQVLTNADAARAATLLKNEWATRYADIGSAEAVTPSFSDDIVALANGTDITNIDQLPHLTGFELNDGGANLKTIAQFTADDVDRIAGWGFNSIRYMFNYFVFFNEDLTQVNVSELQRLDALVEAAVRNNIHMDLMMLRLPGFSDIWDAENMEYTYGDYDLFLNPIKQEKAKLVWSTIAERYKDIPGAYLSFTPLFEPMRYCVNTFITDKSLVTSYTVEDSVDTLELLVQAIREKDPDRFIFYTETLNLT